MNAESTEPDHRRRIALGIAAAVVLALVVVLFVVLQNRGDDDAPPSSSTPPSSTTTPAPTPGTSKAPTTPGPTPSVPPVETNAPKPIPAKLTDKVALDNGVAIEVADIESVQGKARGVGEVAGPALRFTVQVTNKSKKAVDLDLAIVNAYYGSHDDPASELSGPGASPLPQKVKAGGVASGKYVFGIPVKDREHVRVDFSYTIDQSTIIFRGSAN